MYTTDEISAAVQQLVRTSVRRPYDATGVRRTDVTFNDMNDAAAGVYVLYPNALYYTVKLAVDRCARAVEANQSLLTSFMQYVSAVARHVPPITSLNSLANARVALQELASASSVRESGFKSITETSAYQRFDNNTQRFLDETGGAVKSGGDIVPTPEEARSQFAATFNDLQDGFVDVVRRATLLAQAVDDFDKMDLPATLFGSVVSNSQDLIATEYTKLSSMTPEERLTSIRDTILNILAMRSSVSGFGNLSSPGMFYILDGNGGVYADANYVPEHASLMGDQYGPFNILGTANELDLRLDGDGGITTTVMVQPSFVPFIEGTVKEDYIITVAPIDNTKFRLGLKNWPFVYAEPSVSVVQAPGTYDAWEVCQTINTAITSYDPSTPLLAEPYCNPLRYTGNFNIALVGIVYAFTATNPAAVDFVALGVQDGDPVIIRDVTAAGDRNIGVVDVGGVFTDHLNIVPAHGAFVNETNKTCQVGNGALAIRLRITDDTDSNISKPDYRLQALVDRVSIYIPQTYAGSVDDQLYGASVLGFVPLMEAMARPTPASEVELTFNAQPGAAVNGVARVQATAVFQATLFSGHGRTNPYDPNQFVAYKYQGTCDVTGGTGVSFNCVGALTAGVDIGDIVVIRKTSVPGNVNKFGAVAEVTDTYILANFITPVTASTNIDIEIGPYFSRDDILDAAVVVSGNTANDGDYIVRSYDRTGIPFELTVNNRIPVPYGIGNLPVTCTLNIGRHVMKFESLKEDLTAELYMSTESNPASAFFKFFTSAPQHAYGSTVYYKPPSLPKGLSEGDMLELYTVNLTPTFVGTITVIDSSTGVLGLEIALPTNTSVMPFTHDSPVPFARIRRMHADNYSIFSTALQAWLDGLNLDQNFVNLTRALNVLLVNTNPTPSQVNDAATELTDLNNILLDVSTILSSYEAPVIEQVDVLVKSFREKGSDRAVDVLLECRFSEFFGLGEDGISYTAYVKSAIKDVENNDLPVRKFDRLGKYKAKQTLLAEWDEQDFEFSKGDADPEQPYDPPGTTDFLTPRG